MDKRADSKYIYVMSGALTDECQNTLFGSYDKTGEVRQQTAQKNTTVLWRDVLHMSYKFP